MAYLDLYDNITINKRVLKLLGMPTALYWAELQDILRAVKRKRTFDSAGYFKLDRAYVESETTLNSKQQYECDQVLIGLGVLAVDPMNADRLSINYQQMIGLIVEEDVATMKEVTKLAKPTRAGKKVATEEEKRAKENGRKQNLKNSLIIPEREVYDATCAWIDAIFEAGTWSFKLTKTAVETFVKTVQMFTSVPAEQIQIIETCSSNGWTDASWGIERFKKTFRSAAMAGTTTIASRTVVAPASGPTETF